MTTAELVVNYLHTLQERGMEKLTIDDSARGILREWMLAARRGPTQACSKSGKEGMKHGDEDF